MTTSNSIRQASWNPGRVLAALGRIGYSPASAILDIVDNSVSNGASRVEVKLNVAKEESGGRGATRAVLRSIEIIDNGCGMDANGLDNALSLGSSKEVYGPGTLSKFGLGLKSAAASLGRQLEIISRTNGEPDRAQTATLDLDVVFEKNEYVYELNSSSDEDRAILDSVATKTSGTLIRISKLNLHSMPSAVKILATLEQKAGTVYFYYLKGAVPNRSKLQISINEKQIEPFDPLFIERISSTEPNLNEQTWSGLNVQWISHSFQLQLDPTTQAKALVDITQLPHPPSVAYRGLMTQKQCRDEYMIGAGNYGFYVYRNFRLISWADSLDMVPQDQDLYSFRGRLLIDSSSDELLNIDVSKSRIELSEIARTQLEPELREAIKKSQTAWQNAGRNLKMLSENDPHSRINEELDKIGKLEEREEQLDEDVTPEPARKNLQQRKEFAQKSKPINEDESEKLRKNGQRVHYAQTLDHNQLWERAHDPELGLIVRINSSHRFFREYIQPALENEALINAHDLLFYGLASGEKNLVYRSTEKPEVIEKLLNEFRERVGNQLSEFVRSLEDE